jgi:hypothetical protein
MFDPVACAKLVLGTPCADLTTLLELKQALPSVPMKMRHRPTRSLALRARKDDLANAHARYRKN